MTYQELINNIRDLGFSDDTEMEDFGELVANGVNRAITTINTEVDPIVSNYELVIDDTDEGYLYLTMPDVDSRFLDFDDVPVKVQQSGKDTYTRFADYEIEGGDTIVIDADRHKGTFRVFYMAAHEPYTGTQVATELPLKQRVHHLVPLLASYYVWLEDEPVKAAQYYNLYEQMVQTFRDNSVGKRPRVRVLEGGI